jgi:hypothetical protein
MGTPIWDLVFFIGLKNVNFWQDLKWDFMNASFYLSPPPSLKLEDSRTFRWAAYNTTQLQGYSTLIFILTATLSSPSSPPQLLTHPLSTFSSAIVPSTEYTQSGNDHFLA